MLHQSQNQLHLPHSGSRHLIHALLCLLGISIFLQPALCQQDDTMKSMDMNGKKQDPMKSMAPDQANMSDGKGKMDMDIVHPFFTHMGMPDAVGKYALRLSAVSTRNEGKTRGDMGFHLETGIAKKFGLHIRNDRVSNNAHTEIMVQYAAIQSKDGMSGFSPFVELEIPTHEHERHAYGLIGFSTMWTATKLQMNQSLEYSPREEALEGSLSIVAKVGQSYFPVVEFIMAASRGATPINSMIGGLKYKVNKSTVIGLALQLPVTESKEFTHQVILQTDIEW